VPTEKNFTEQKRFVNFCLATGVYFLRRTNSHPQKDALCSLIRQLFNCSAVLNQPRTGKDCGLRLKGETCVAPK
jgi:hypothetical protein